MFSGTRDLDLDKFIKPEYLKAASPYQDIKIPGKVEHKIPAHRQEATCLAFNAIGDAIATGGADSVIKVWQSENGKEVQSLKGFNRTITDVSFSMDNEYLAGASTEHKVMLWRLKTMRTTQTFSGHKDAINACKFAFVIKGLITGS
jgi:WD40 repeat protein